MDINPIFLQKFGTDLFTFFERTPDLVCIAGRDGYLKKINPAVSYTLGYTEVEMLSRPVKDFIYEPDREATALTRQRMIEGEPLLNFQNRYVARNGNIVWLEWTSIYLPEKDMVFAIAKNVTAGKVRQFEMETEFTRFRNLATHFKASNEEERKVVANELHENIAQLAAAVKMDMEWIRDNETDLRAASLDRFDHATRLCDTIITSIRRMSFAISPHMIDDIGLIATLEWLAGEFSILQGIPCDWETEYDETSLSREIKIDFFRICQYALSNVRKHSEASQVWIRLEDKGDSIMFSVVDNGKGFNPGEIKGAKGFTAMREQASSINGTLEIDSRPGEGTRISVLLNKRQAGSAQ